MTRKLSFVIFIICNYMSCVLDDPRVFINAAIIDLELPEIGGFQIIGELARMQKRPIPIMAVTGVYNDVHLEVAEYLGAKISVETAARPAAQPHRRWPKSSAVGKSDNTGLADRTRDDRE